jgi:hypothetical protein
MIKKPGSWTLKNDKGLRGMKNKFKKNDKKSGAINEFNTIFLIINI